MIDVRDDAPEGPKIDRTRHYFDTIERTHRTFVPKFSGAVVTTEEEHTRICREYSQGATINAMCATWGWPRDLMRGYLQIHERTHDREGFTDEELMERPLDDLRRDALQERRGEVLRALKQDDWKETSRLAERQRRFEVTTLEPMLAAMREGRAFMPARIPVLNWKPAPFDLVIAVFDAHADKDCVDDDADVLAYIDQATERLMARVLRMMGRPTRIILANGGDTLHVNGPDNATRRGTKQDTIKTIRASMDRVAMYQATQIEKCRHYAPVDYMACEGNHDETTGFAPYLYVLGCFKGDKRVTIHPYAPRVYTVSGRTQVLVTHKGKTASGAPTLGQVAAQERPQDWAATDRTVILVGDLHHLEAKEEGRVEKYQLRSPNGTDDWHNASAYVGSRRTITGLVLSHNHPGLDTMIHVGIAEVGA